MRQMTLFAIENEINRHLLNEEANERRWEALVADIEKLFKLRDVCTVEELAEYTEDMLRDRYDISIPYGFLDEVSDLCKGAVSTRELEAVVWHYIEHEYEYPNWDVGGHGECCYDHGCLAKWGSYQGTG